MKTSPDFGNAVSPVLHQPHDYAHSFKLAEQTDSGFPQLSRGHLNINQENVKSGLAKLVLTLIRLLHELLEKQAIRRIEAESLDEDEIERLGLTLMKQAEEIQRVCEVFGLSEDDLNLDLGPLGNLI